MFYFVLPCRKFCPPPGATKIESIPSNHSYSACRNTFPIPLQISSKHAIIQILLHITQLHQLAPCSFQCSFILQNMLTLFCHTASHDKACTNWVPVLLLTKLQTSSVCPDVSPIVMVQFIESITGWWFQTLWKIWTSIGMMISNWMEKYKSCSSHHQSV